jgi:fatty-acyl-CoA synthase
LLGPRVLRSENARTGNETSNRSCLEVENIISQHPGVTDVSVIGVPDEEWGEVMKAVVVTNRAEKEITAEEIISFCRERLAGYKSPKRISFKQSLPRIALGKIAKEGLRKASNTETGDFHG